MLERVAPALRRRGLTLLPPLGFENTFAILVRGDDAERLGLRTIDDAAPHTPSWQAGFGYEFLQRADGYPGLSTDIRPAVCRRRRTAMDLSLIYRALAERQVDLIAGDATSGLIQAYDLVMLEDNRHYFPPYDAVPVARRETLLRHPEVREALERLGGRITIEDMRPDEPRRGRRARATSPAVVARFPRGSEAIDHRRCHTAVEPGR